MTDDVTTPTPATKAEALAAERKVAREAKEAKRAAEKAANKEKRENGVIGTIRTMLSTPTGATKAEVLAALVQKFPDRDPMGMSCTIGIQFSRLAKSIGKIDNAKVEGRGRVYGVRGTLVLPEVVAEATPAKPAGWDKVETANEDAPKDASKGPLEGRDALKALSTPAKRKGGKK